ncbi:hypothetical protein LguiB_029229 [Lonicera macranthoides]
MIAQRKFDKDHSINIRSSQQSNGLARDHSYHTHASNACHGAQKINDHMPKFQEKSFK